MKRESVDRALLLGGGGLAAIFCMVGVVLHALYGYSIPFSGNAFGSDDAFISYRYAANLLAGNGLVFNAGESVEGYSNFLYILLVVPGLLFGHEYIYLFSLSLNCVLLVGSCLLVQQLINRHMGALPALIGACLLALSPALWANAATGLESVLMLFLVLVTWALLDRSAVPFPLLGLAALAGILCRVDGFILPLLAAAYLWLDGRRDIACRLVLFVAVTMLLYTMGRIIYYQDYISNTYHAKVSGGVLERVQWGIIFLINNSKFNGIAIYALLAISFSIVWRSVARRHLFPLIYLVFSLAYYIYIGGDIYYERFLLAVIPIGIFFVLLCCVQLRRVSALLILPALVLFSGMLVLLKDERFAYQVKQYDMWESLGRFLRQAPRDALLAIDAAGKVPYYSMLPTLDMLGLNDRHIGQRKMPEQPFLVAHTKRDPDYVLSRSPQLIAAWVGPNLDLAWDMTRSKYLANYEVKYLVNTQLNSNGRDIIDVQGMSVQEMENLVAQHYNYGVLARRELVSQLPLAESLQSPPSLAPDTSINFMENAALPGWYSAEAEHRWASGKTARILFKVHADAVYKGRINMNLASLGVQRVSISLNGQRLGGWQFDSWNEQIDLDFDPEQLNRVGTNILEFELPDSRKAGSDDPRLLGIALRNLTIH